jgi:hypothetical protein
MGEWQGWASRPAEVYFQQAKSSSILTVKSTGLPSFNAGSKRQVPTVLTASSFETPTSCLDHLDIVWQSVSPDHYADHYSSRARAIFALSEHSGSGSYVSLGSMTPNNKVVVAIANKLARIAWAVLSSGKDYRHQPLRQLAAA